MNSEAIKSMPLHQLYMLERELQEEIKRKEKDAENYLQYCEKGWD